MTPQELGLTDVHEGDFLTKKLGVTYAEPEDNTRKASSKDIIEKQVVIRLARWCKQHKLLSKYNWAVDIKTYLLRKELVGKIKRDNKEWPNWVVKTDEERCQNLPELFPGDGTWWVATEKIDGSSTTFTMRQDKPRKRKAIVCSRNVVFNPKLDVNDYVEMYNKYNFEKVLNFILDSERNCEYVTIQGEMYGPGVQKRTYGVSEKHLAIFNIIIKQEGMIERRLNPVEMTSVVNTLNQELGLELECVPVVDTHFLIPETCEELLLIADGTSKLDGAIREGLVFRDYKGQRSFKAVSNQYLLTK